MLKLPRETATFASPPFRTSLLETSEDEGTAQAAAGSVGAFEEVGERHERRIFRVGQNITRSPQNSEHTMQNADGLPRQPEFSPRFTLLYTAFGHATVQKLLMRFRHVDR